MKYLEIFICSCANSEPIARKALQIAHHPNYMKHPIIRDKQPSLSRVRCLIQDLPASSYPSINRTLNLLYDALSSKSKFVYILAIDTNRDKAEFEDVASNGKTQLDHAIDIIKRHLL